MVLALMKVALPQFVAAIVLWELFARITEPAPCSVVVLPTGKAIPVPLPVEFTEMVPLLVTVPDRMAKFPLSMTMAPLLMIPVSVDSAPLPDWSALIAPPAEVENVPPVNELPERYTVE